MAITFNGADLVVDFKEVAINGAERQYQIDYVCASTTVTHYVQEGDTQSTDVDGLRFYTDTLTYAENKAAGLTRTPTVRLRTQNADGKWSAWEDIDAVNPLPVLPDAPEITPTFNGATVSVRTPTDTDFEGFVAWLDTSTNVAMDDAHKCYQGKADTFTVPVEDDATYYLRVCPYDAFGLDTASAWPPLPLRSGQGSFYLATVDDRLQTETRSRFDPIFWTTNFPSTMIAALTNTADDALRLAAIFYEKGHLAGIIWESADTLDHPTTGYDTNKDYRNCVLEFDIELVGDLQDLNDIDGPTLTIEGRDDAGVAATYYVYLGNVATGDPTSAHVTLDFNDLPGGFAGGETVYCGDVDRMFISAVPNGYVQDSTSRYTAPKEASVLLTNIAVSGTNADLICGLGSGGVHEVRMTNGYDDTYNIVPARLVRNCQLLGYKEDFNHYVGMSHYFHWLWDDTEARYIAQDSTTPLNTACVKWHEALAAELAAVGMRLIFSLSYELLNSFAPATWRQLDSSGNPALTGWTPPSTLLSPCNATAMSYLQSAALQFAGIAASAGLDVHFQVGEPWYWISFDGTRVPFFYDNATTTAYTSETGLSAPVITDMGATMSAAQTAYLDWLGGKLAGSILDLQGAVRTAHAALTSYVLLYLPQLLDEDAPENHRVNMPAALAYPAVDVLQLEDYDFVVAGDREKSAQARGRVETILGYPRSRQQYFAGFALFQDLEGNIWRNSSTALKDAYEWGVFPCYIWAYSQVMRDGYVPVMRVAPPVSMRDVRDVHTPTPPSDGQVLYYDAATKSFHPAAVSEVPGALTKFTDLTDTPSSYLGHPLEFARVKSDGSGLEFAPVLQLPTGGAASTILQKFGAGDGEATWSDLTAGIVSFTPTGSVSSTDVQSAVAEIDSDLTSLTGVVATKLDGSAIDSGDGLVPTLNSPWINYGGGFGGARYYKSADGVVHIEGLIQAASGNPTTGVVLFNLLSGYRPPDNLMFCTWNGGGAGRIDVQSNGDVVMQSGNTAFTSLTGISFVPA